MGTRDAPWLPFNQDLYHCADIEHIPVGWYHNKPTGNFSQIPLNKYFWVFLIVFGLRPTHIPRNPKYDASDVTVMIPTLGLNSALLHQVAESILVHPVAKLIIVASGPDFEQEFEAFTEAISDPRVQVLNSEHAGRRRKTALAMPYIKTSLVVLQDNKTAWPASPNFLPLMMAPFEDPTMGAVMPLIEARHRHHRSWREAFFNFLGITYLTRRNHEYRACNAIDGGLSIVPGRFGIFRTSIYADPVFQHEYLNEYVGGKGPLDADDDKFHTRWLIEHKWKMKIQSTPETTMITENGQSNRFWSQILRWTRTTWRSNPRELKHGRVWRQHPFTAMSLMLWMIRVSFIHEAAMFGLWYMYCRSAGLADYFVTSAVVWYLWVVVLKFNKIAHHFRQYPKDLMFFPAYLAFGYPCSFVKIYAFFTRKNTEWVTAEPVAGVKGEDAEDLDDGEAAPGAIHLD
ncbi:hypothetical protein E8E11_010326 [Didymella keratinophila]|nr:hypothetical protein E8E11_010326 [Didymella keratinophila]